MVRGIDVSGHNGSINWREVHADGIRFAFIKVNEGDWIDKSTTQARVKAAKEAGVLVGGYNFVRPKPGRTGAQEFDIFYKRAKEVGLLSKGSLRPVIDIEATGFTGATKAWRTRVYVRSWIKRCEQRLGVKPIIYTGQWFWDGVMKGTAYTARSCRLWLAAYVPESKFKGFKPKGFERISIWQYTDEGRVNGIKGRVDRNRYLGTWESFQNYKLTRSA